MGPVSYGTVGFSLTNQSEARNGKRGRLFFG
jgi:hypothetical protein